MAKQIVYLVTQNGVDGREPTSQVAAFFDEGERDNFVATSKNKNWYSTEEKIIDVDAAYKKALAKLNEVDKLVLGLP